jgi:hypothetical protein
MKTPDEIEGLKTKFIEETRIANAISDATKTRRGRPVFKKGQGQEQRREEFRYELSSKLREYAKAYTVEVKDDAHITTIRSLMEHMTVNYKDILFDDELAFGVAQKVLNVYLKSLWCADGATLPPHCPFDDNILRKIRPRKRRGQPYTFSHRWTYANESEYREWVVLAKGNAGEQSLPAWELEEWQAAQDQEQARIAERAAKRKENPPAPLAVAS